MYPQPDACLQPIAAALPGVSERRSLNELLDEVEVLLNRSDPESRRLAETIRTAVRRRLQGLRA